MLFTSGFFHVAEKNQGKELADSKEGTIVGKGERYR